MKATGAGGRRQQQPNAGHPSPYCDGREIQVESGLPLGVVAGVSYEETTFHGALFTFVSDGVVEAENTERELFGFERTRDMSIKAAREIAEAAQAWGQALVSELGGGWELLREQRRRALTATPRVGKH